MKRAKNRNKRESRVISTKHEWFSGCIIYTNIPQCVMIEQKIGDDSTYLTEEALILLMTKNEIFLSSFWCESIQTKFELKLMTSH